MSWSNCGNWLIYAVALIIASAVLIGCTNETPESTATPQPPPAPTSTSTPTPTLTPTPTPTLTPTPAPTLTPTPTPTPTPVPTATPTPTPSPEDLYYTQFVTVKGVTIKGNDAIDPMALSSAAGMIGPMLSGRPDIAECIAETGMEVAIISKDEKITALPEYAHLEDVTTTTHDGRSWASLRGLNSTRLGLALMAISEEKLLGLNVGPVWRIAHTTVHEFAHSIQNLCFTAEDHSEWDAFYDSALQDNLYPETYLMSNTREFFAVFSTAYFEVYSFPWYSLSNSRDDIEDDHPAIFEFLDEVYGGAELPTELKRLTAE